MDVFCKKIGKIESDIMKILTTNNKMIMAEQDEQDLPTPHNAIYAEAK